jgi:hypothetical protein
VALDTPASDEERPLAIPLLLAFLAAYVLAALVLAPGALIGLAFTYFRQMYLLVGILIVALPIAGAVLKPRSPLGMAAEIIRRGGMRLSVVVVCFCLGMAAFTTFKIAIPAIVPFYADELFADIDAALHFGNPGEHLHALLPGWVAEPIVTAYTFLWFSLWFGLLGFVALHDDSALRRRYFWSMALTMVLLGTIGATAFSSVGPIFYDAFIPGDRFAPLLAALRDTAAGDLTFQTAGYLLSAYRGEGGIIGTGISAMPSMHLAIVTLNALMLGSLNRWAGLAGWAYVALILIGSVYLAWHYAIDGYFSIAVVPLIWWLAGRFTRAG